MALITIDQMKQPDKYYFIPSRFENNDNRLLGVIEAAEFDFCHFFNISESDINNEEKKEALRYWIFSFWQQSERYQKTGHGAGVDPTLVKGSPVYDLQKEIYCTNRAINTMNRFLPKSKQRKMLKPFLNY